MPLHVKIKHLLKKVLPENLFILINKTWRLTFSRFFTGADIHDKYKKIYFDKYPAVVNGGPFIGMKYISSSAGSTYLLKLIGCYEAVLHPFISKVILRDYDTVIDIGCAEGYYLVGIGLKLPKAKLIGYDIDANARTLTQELAEINNIENQIEIKSDCTAESLQADLSDKSLVICDAEGFEREILDPDKTPSLKNTKTILVETHEFVYSDVIDVLKQRFQNTHSIETVTFNMANPKDYPFLADLDPNAQYNLLRERGEQEQKWLILEKIN